MDSSGSVVAQKVTRAKLVAESDQGQKAKTGQKLRRGSRRKRAKSALQGQDATSVSDISSSRHTDDASRSDISRSECTLDESLTSNDHKEDQEMNETLSSMVIKSCSSKSELSETPTLSPPPPNTIPGGPRESVENSAAPILSTEKPETPMEKLLKKERRHLVVQLDDVSFKHQEELKKNAELRKSLEAERSRVGDLEKELASMVAASLLQGNAQLPRGGTEPEVKASSKVPKGKLSLQSEIGRLEEELERVRAGSVQHSESAAKAKQEKDELEAEAEGMRSKLTESSREREGLRSEVGQLETELESMKAKLVGADEKRLEVNHRLAAKEIKIGELEKDVARLKFEREKVTAKKDGELAELRSQLCEVQEAAAGKSLEILRLGDQVHNLGKGQKFVKETFNGLSRLESEARNQKQLVNQRLDHMLTQICSFKSYMGDNLYKYASDEEE